MSAVLNAASVTHSGLTFVEALKQKLTKLNDLDDWVEAWHTCASLSDKSLRDYLGFDKDRYGAWMRNGDDALIDLRDS